MSEQSIIQPLFPSSYIIYKNIDIDHDQVLKELKKLKFTYLPDIQTGATQDKKLFKSLKNGTKLKNKLEFYLRKAVNEILEYKVDVNLINMWGTETKSNTVGTSHLHKNYWYSCCYYPHGDIKDNFKLKFFTKHHEHYDIPVTKFNIFNSTTWEQPVEKGDLLIFPSGTLHQICLNTSKNTRYSIAANFLPKGKIGERDGELILK
jgi:hypothetical protein